MGLNDFISIYEGKELAQKYHKYRTTIPPHVAEQVVGRLRQCKGGSAEKTFDRMLDVGCGSGQAIKSFSPYFKHILGVDISAEQLEVAEDVNEFDNVTYKKMLDNNLPVGDNSIDLVTCVDAAHWFDIEYFTKECQRVLKPDGCAVIYVRLEASMILLPEKKVSNQKDLDYQFDQLNRQFLKDINGHERNNLILERYVPLFKKIPTKAKSFLDGMQFTVDWTLRNYREFWTTKGEYYALMKNNRPDVDPLDIFIERLKRFLGAERKNEDDIKTRITYDLPAIVITKS
uniref:probable S-adenosylmethionine-dependent methyltransferase CRG1 n=1 Tax=Styela clava TaxID=7725 RepID=UPI00193A1704|nr:probable S-adenosylmethionine-dependent methyltransferase CRG1 [Styela clava]